MQSALPPDGFGWSRKWKRRQTRCVRAVEEKGRQQGATLWMEYAPDFVKLMMRFLRQEGRE